MKSKGKEISGKASTSKRKRNDTDKSGGRKKKTPGVLQFFDVSADVDKDEDLSEDDDFERDFMDGLDTEPKGKNESGKAHHIPFLPKEEEISDDELERLLEERYRPGSRNVVYAEDEYDTKGSGDKISLLPSLNDPIIWRVKCMVGRERQTAFCLMQKYVDVQSIGTKLKIASAFVLEHIKGHIYIEADRESDIVEACKGICSIYSSRMSRVPTNEVHHLFSLRNTSTELSKGTWVRVKYGNYKGDLAQVVAVDDSRKKTTVKRATVKIIPRIDLQALAKKLGGGGTVKQTDVPVPRLISSTELEDFRPHIQSKRDRQSGMVFESLDGLMLKDGYLYKRVPIESLTYLDVLPSAMELQKFRTSSKDASDNMEWLSNLYGEQQKKSLFKCGKGTTKGEGKGTTKGEGTSGTTKGDGFELHDLVFFGRKDFGVIIGVEDDNFQILKDGVDEEEVVTVEHHEIKNGSFDKKFTALDQNMKIISVNDTVCVLEGPLKDKQGIVRQIYRGTIFIYDENQLENGGYFCAKAQLCEKISHSIDAHQENIGDESGAAGFEDATSPNKPWQAKENRRDFNGRRQEDREGDFSIGQSLRIRVGDLKGHLCRVIAIYRSEVTVKVDSKMNIIKVKREHLSEAGVKSMWGPECNTTKPFDAFGTQGSSGGLGEGSGTLAESNGWNSAVPSTGRSSWPDFPASSGFLLDSTFSNPFGSLANDDDPKKGKDEEDDPWGSKVASKKATDIWNKAIDVGADLKSSWSKPTSEGKSADAKLDQVDNWGKSTDSWNKPTANNTGFGSNVTDSWGTGKLQIGSSADRSSDAMGSWGKKNSTSNDPEPAWGKGKSVIGNETGAWGKAVENQGKENTVNLNQEDSWGKASESWKAKDGSSGSKTGAWGKPVEIQGTENTVKSNQEDSWGKASDSWKAKDGSSGSKTGAWGKPVEIQGKENTVKSNPEDSWGKASDGWKAKDGSSGSKTGGWNNASASQGNQSGGWGNNSTGGCTQTESARIDRVSSWNNAGGATDGEGANMASVWNKGTATVTGDGSWNRSKGTDGDQEFGWNKGRMGNKEGDEDKDQHSTWGRPSFDGGRGSGGRRGRGGFRGGNRGNFNGGRSFGRGRSSGWNKDDEQRGTGDGESFGRPSSGWSNDRADDWNKTKAFDGDQQNAGGNGNQGGDGWGKPRSGDDHGSNWNKGRAAEHTDGEKGFTGNNLSGWNNNEGNNWSASKASVGKQSSGWTKELVTKEESGGNQSSGWDGKARNWNKTEGNSSSGWNQGPSATNKGMGGRGNEGFDWNKRNASSEDQGSGWKSGTSDMGGNPSSGWDTKASNWNNSKGKQSSGLNPGLSENDETGGSGEQSSGWGSKNISNTQKDSSGHQTSAWDNNKGFASNEDVWNRKKASDGGGQATGWKSGATNETTGWNKGNAFGGGDRSSSWSKGPNTTDGNEDRSNNWNKTTFGNGDDGDNNNWRGGKFFRGGGRSSGWNRGSNADSDAGDPVDSSDQPRGFGRGQSFGSGRGGGFGDRGRGRGGSFGDRGRGRGGFGGRGRGRGGRDQSGGWNREKTDGEDQSVGWSSKDTTDNAGDWGSNDRSGSWNQGGGGRGKGQWQNWNKESGATKETGGTSSQGGGWNDKGSGWNQSSGGTSDGNNGWKSSQGSGWNGGTTGLAKEGSETKVKANNWNQSCAPDGWKKGPDSTKDDFGTNDRAGGGWNSQGSGNRDSDSWNCPNPPVGPASSDWNKPMAAKETGGSWDRAATKDGSSGWNKEEGSVKEAGGPNKQAGGWNSQGSGNGSNAPVGPTSSGWNKPTAAKETSGGWDQATKKDGSGGKGGW